MSNDNDDSIQEFLIEASELLDYAEAELLNAEKGDSDYFYDSTFRAFHSIKGGAGMLGLTNLQNHMHKLESQWIPLKGSLRLNKSESDYFLAGIDASRKILQGDFVEFNYKDINSNKSIQKESVKELTKELEKKIDIQNNSSESITTIKSNASHGLVYVVDDEPDVLEIVKTVLAEENFDVSCFENADSLFEAINDRIPDVVITDFKMPAKNGLAVLSEVRRLIPDVPVIILTGYITKEILIDSLREGGFYSAIEKPFKNINLIQDCLSACRFHEAKKMVKRSLNLLVYQFSDLEKYLISQNQHDVAKTIGNELKFLLKKQRDLTHWKIKPNEPT